MSPNFSPYPIERVKNVSKRVYKNLQAFFAVFFIYKPMGYLAKKGFQRIFAGGKFTSKRVLPIKK